MQYFHNLTIDQISKDVKTDIKNGLSQEEADRRNIIYGLNNYEAKRQKRLIWLLLAQFRSPFVYLLVVGAMISFYFDETLEGIAILLVIFINAAIGFVMEIQARRSMNALKKLEVSFSKVIREGTLQEIDSARLTIGDIVFVEGGDVLPADGRVVEAVQLTCDESALTGESLPVEKVTQALEEQIPLAERLNMAFKGTSVLKGNGKILISAIGLETELGKITALVEASEETATPLDKKLEGLTKKLVWVTVVVAVLFIISGIVEGKPLSIVLETAIALSVAAIPEGLPIVATIALAVGVLLMAKRNAIVKNLSSVETLGGTSVILTDKTGTLTENKIVTSCLVLDNKIFDLDTQNVSEIFAQIAVSEVRVGLERLLLASALCNNADVQKLSSVEKEVGDPLEVALIRFVELTGRSFHQIKKSYPRKGEEPFSSETKIMATVSASTTGLLANAKGSVEHLLERCNRILKGENEVVLDQKRKEEIIDISESLSEKGLRVLAFAYNFDKEINLRNFYNELVFIGLIGFLDPPRIDIIPAMEACREAGIKVVMVTGDHPKTAATIARKVGMLQEGEAMAMSGSELPETGVYSEALKERILSTAVFARVTPKQKLDLVAFYQEKGDIVAMTGDGVNDAPALKKADIGIAMGLRGTQVAKETANIVLKDDSFNSIVAAISYGRGIFQNIRKFVVFLISCNLSEILIVTALGFFLPSVTLLPLQILFINMITDVLPALALGMGKPDPAVLKNPPRNPKSPIVTFKDWKKISLYAFIISLGILAGVSFCFYYLRLDNESCNAVCFLSLALAQLWHVFNMNEKRFPVGRNKAVKRQSVTKADQSRKFSTAPFANEITTNKYVWLAIVACLGIILLVVTIPWIRGILHIEKLDLKVSALSLLVSLIPLIVNQGFKLFQPNKS